MCFQFVDPVSYFHCKRFVLIWGDKNPLLLLLSVEDVCNFVGERGGGGGGEEPSLAQFVQSVGTQLKPPSRECFSTLPSTTMRNVLMNSKKTNIFMC